MGMLEKTVSVWEWKCEMKRGACNVGSYKDWRILGRSLLG